MTNEIRTEAKLLLFRSFILSLLFSYKAFGIGNRYNLGLYVLFSMISVPPTAI